ncbi:hypothetical protein LSAT2_022948 [Lamellibrachia satsuma]|nr:hypothetical protein LSAT2_022948 [Lamellibrachia satsuma]
MAAPMPRDLASAAAAGNLAVVEKLLASGADVNGSSKDGMTPLSIAAFWGYANIAQLLLQHGAEINKANKGTMWTPLHCASFQRQGPVIHKLMAFSPDLQLKDMRGRTAADFASASDSIWPFFAAAGCSRTPTSRLTAMDIVHKMSYEAPSITKMEHTYFPQSSPNYGMRSPEPQHDPRLGYN